MRASRRETVSLTALTDAVLDEPVLAQAMADAKGGALPAST